MGIEAIRNVILRHMGPGATVLLVTHPEGNQTIVGTTCNLRMMMDDYRSNGCEVCVLAAQDTVTVPV